MRPKDLGALMLLGALWGGSFLFIRVAVEALGPFVLMELRVGLAVLALTLYALAVGRLSKLRARWRSEEHTSELQSRQYLVCRLLLEKKKKSRLHLSFT